MLQYGVMVIEGSDERFDIIIGLLRQLIVAMKNESTPRPLRQRGRPEINIGEEQLAYLLEQGFRTKDISAMFGCSRRAIERRMKKYEHWVHHVQNL